ncbi:hypothetical protein C1646_669520 [Rhizophagus diaphanus]|nr:hypothetical protein C1646_669520 [Rhizophagus diaphanus] [Rhizophagus sp. MUCL 43196]
MFLAGLTLSLEQFINQNHTDNEASFSECMYYFKNSSTASPTIRSSQPNANEDNGNDSDPTCQTKVTSQAKRYDTNDSDDGENNEDNWPPDEKKLNMNTYNGVNFFFQMC